ncbi:MAG TPA: alkaline phosphatase family protein [Steroidobacteraceae bacterium]|nr:alkaline phosphatase family protein [Steroidobacteraceae bacterium]
MRSSSVTIGFMAPLLCSLATASAVQAQGAFPAYRAPTTSTPIRHLVVIFDENNSFDHYFGTYPVALNPPGETPFHAAPGTPAVNGLTPTLLSNNPNQANAGNPMRLDPSQAATCDNINKYTPEQQAFDNGLLDKFNITSAADTASDCGAGDFYAPDLAMYYYDGNTVTALWNYAQHFAMSDNFFDTEFGGTVEGHLNLISGQTNGLVVMSGETASGTVIANDTVINNVDPIDDDCAQPGTPTGSSPNVSMTGMNIGNLLNQANVTWGWFYDGFARTGFSDGVAICNSLYNPHYAPFDYYPSTANPHHTPPSSAQAIGTSADAANHDYDLSDLWEALDAGNLPAVTFIKAASPNTGHPMNSTPLAEQAFLVDTINRLMQSRYWNDMAIIIAYDDSDGWYDHVAAPIVNHSTDGKNDAIQGTAGSSGACGALGSGADNDRCGFGVRLPFLVISPYARHNFVDHSLNDTTSIMRFIEYNWHLGTLGSLGVANDAQSFDVLASGSILGMFDFNATPIAENRALILDPTTGQVVGPDAWPY